MLPTRSLPINRARLLASRSTPIPLSPTSSTSTRAAIVLSSPPSRPRPRSSSPKSSTTWASSTPIRNPPTGTQPSPRPRPVSQMPLIGRASPSAATELPRLPPRRMRKARRIHPLSRPRTAMPRSWKPPQPPLMRRPYPASRGSGRPRPSTDGSTCTPTPRRSASSPSFSAPPPQAPTHTSTTR